MKIECVGPIDFTEGTFKMVRGEVVEFDTDRALQALHTPGSAELFAEECPFELWLVRKNGHKWWISRRLRRPLRDEGWKQAEPAEVLAQATHVLVLRQMGLGDMLMLTPTLRALSRDLGKRVSLMTHERYRPLFAGNPYLDKVWGFDTYADEGFRAEDYDGFLNLLWFVEYDDRNNAMPRTDLFAEGAGVSLKDHWLDYSTTPDAVEWARAELEGCPRPVTLLQTGSGAWQRRLSDPMLVALLERLRGTPILVGDGSTEVPPAAKSLIGGMTLQQLFALTEQADLVIAPDSGLAHVAGATQTPCIVQATSIPYHLRYSYYPKHRCVDGCALVGACYCLDARTCQVYDRCPPCVTAVTPEMILAEANAVFEGAGL